MHPQYQQLPLFILYIALDDGLAVDLTDELMERAQAIRTDCMFYSDNVD